MHTPSSAQIVLASSSRYRRELLARLGLEFSTAAPEVDETPIAGEPASQLALRLANAKAHAVAKDFPAALIIGSDQVAMLGSTPLNKPGNYKNAAQQLRLMSGQAVSFFTALCLVNARTRRVHSDVVTVTVRMRRLSEAQIDRYLRADQPYDCAGSARIEALGITLVHGIESDDPSALIGLPLIRLCDMLAAEGIELP